MTTLVEDIWAHPDARRVLGDLAFLRTAGSITNARGVLMRQGFEAEGLDIALGVSYAESEGYQDAVGDVTLVDAKWGPSVGLFQVRALRDPLAFGPADRYRFAWALLDPDFNAHAAWVLSNGGTNWSLWSTYTSGSYLARKGKNYTIKSGHVRANQWDL